MTVTAETPVSAGRIRAILDDLVQQRQRMRAGVREPGLAEANRLAIAYWQRQLARALLAEREGARP